MTSITITADDKKNGFTLRELDIAVHHLVASGFNPDTSRITASTSVRGRVTSLTAKTVNDPAPPSVSDLPSPTTWVLAATHDGAMAALDQRRISHGSFGNDRHGVKIRTSAQSLHGAVVTAGDKLLSVDAPPELVHAFEFVLNAQGVGYADLDVIA